jgi:hypothetical protein
MISQKTSFFKVSVCTNIIFVVHEPHIGFWVTVKLIGVVISINVLGIEHVRYCGKYPSCCREQRGQTNKRGPTILRTGADIVMHTDTPGHWSVATEAFRPPENQRDESISSDFQHRQPCCHYVLTSVFGSNPSP